MQTGPDWSVAIDALAQSRHVVLSPALPEPLVEALAAEFTQNQAAGRFRPAAIGRGGGAGVNNGIRGDASCWLEPDMPAGGAYLGHMDSLRQALNRELYLGLHEFEAHYASYPAGSVYQRHVDRHRDSDARIVSAVLYLNRNWPAAAGGELKLYDSADRLLLTLPPRWNTLLLFMSDNMPHEVLAASRERWSIAGWFRR